MTETRIRTPLGTTLVWIDAREAVLVRGVTPDAAEPTIERLESDVPAHRKGVGHVRHVPPNYGSGAPESGEERRRLEHLERFVARVADRLPPDEHLLILGHGTVREHLERLVRADDVRHGRHRDVACRAADRMTERQLVSALRTHVGIAAPRLGTDEASPGARARDLGRRRLSPYTPVSRQAPRPEVPPQPEDWSED